MPLVDLRNTKATQCRFTAGVGLYKHENTLLATEYELAMQVIDNDDVPFHANVMDVHSSR